MNTDKVDKLQRYVLFLIFIYDRIPTPLYPLCHRFLFRYEHCDSDVIGTIEIRLWYLENEVADNIPVNVCRNSLDKINIYEQSRMTRATFR